MNAIQKAIKNVEQVDLNLSYYIHLATKADTRSNKWIMSEINRLTESLELVEKALTALRGIEAGDVESLKATVKAALSQEIHWELSPAGMVDAVIDHLHATGYLGRLPVIEGLEHALRCVVEEDGDNPIIKAAQEYARRSK